MEVWVFSSLSSIIDTSIIYPTICWLRQIPGQQRDLLYKWIIQGGKYLETILLEKILAVVINDNPINSLAWLGCVWWFFRHQTLINTTVRCKIHFYNNILLRKICWLKQWACMCPGNWWLGKWIVLSCYLQL